MFIKNYFENLANCITNLNYYSDVLKKPFLQSFIFFLVSITLLSFVKAAQTSLIELPKAKLIVEQTIEEIRENYPEDLTFSWNGSSLIQNRNQLIIDYPQNLNLEDYQLPEKLAVFNSQTLSPEDFFSDNTNMSLLYFTNSNMFINSNNGKEWTEYPLDIALNGVAYFEINNNNLSSTLERIHQSIAQNYNKVQLSLSALTSFFFIISAFWFVFIESILVYLIMKLYKLNLEFKQVLILSLNISVPTYILTTIAGLIYPTSNFPLRTISFWVILLLVLLTIKGNKESIFNNK